MKLVLSLFAVALCATVALAEDNHWQGDPAVSEDWFDPANWTLGVPTEDHSAYIENGGKAGIHAGDAFAKYVYIGNTSSDPVSSSTGAIMQTGGNMKIANYMYLTGPMDTPGTYTMTGGALESSGIQVGRYLGNGLFTQIGGNNTTFGLNIGDISLSAFINNPNALDTSLGSYGLIGGQLTTQYCSVGTDGRGRFIQTGGIHEVEETLSIGGSRVVAIMFVQEDASPSVNTDTIPETSNGTINSPNEAFIPLYNSDGRYDLQGGRLLTQDEVIKKTGVLRQTGGQHVVDYLTVTNDGKYTFTGGTLEIQSGLEMDGEMDLQGSAVEIQGSGILNFGQGQLLNSQNASIHAGSNSLTILPKDFDPATQLGNIQSDGLVHIAGNDLVVQADDTIIGRGVIDDHVETSGQIIAAEGKGIDINGGLFVHEGVVDWGGGEITILNDRSGIHDGSITAGSMTVGTSPGSNVYVGGEYSLITTDPTGKFSQNGGTVNLSDRLEVTRGSYELQRGVCNVENYVRVGGVMPMNGFCNNDGSEMGSTVDSTISIGQIIFPPDIPDEFVSRPYSTFEVHGGKLTTPSLGILADYHSAGFIQTAGEVMIQNSVSIQGNGSNQAGYTMYGGTLKTTHLNLGSNFRLADSSVSNGESMLAILGSSAQIQTNVLGFYENSVFTAVPGSSIHITETQDETSVSTFWNPGVYISNTDAAAMSGLSNLTLVYECGLESVAVFEVAGEDRGVGYAGFFENFALDTLQIGSEEGDAYVRLLDDFDNQLDWEGGEVLYVENLFLAAGSTLDLNGLDVYCLNCTIEGTLISGGGALYHNGAMVPPTINPEPATAGLLLIGGLLILRRHKRGKASVE